MPYTKLVDLQDRLSKLCVVKERLVKLLEKELSVMRILHVLQFLLPHWAIVQSVGTNIWSFSTSTTFTLHGLIWMNLSAFLYQRLLSSLTTFPNLVMSRRTIRGTPTSAAVPVSATGRRLVGDRSATNRGPLCDLTATGRRPVRNLF